ncbi:MAG: hypothetical protein HPY54_07645 [Chthonomonadetes bacterium]|nr:hypothetical protein [Chthonomonadetes bacterium]
MEWLSHVDARGGTEVLSALMDAVQLLQSARPDALRAIVLVTDGQVGNEDEIICWMNQAEQRMLELSLKYRVLCRLTAYVAIDRSEKVNEGGEACAFL